jgi:4-azaleucine resistance transporter AzlC
MMARNEQQFGPMVLAQRVLDPAAYDALKSDLRARVESFDARRRRRRRRDRRDAPSAVPGRVPAGRGSEALTPTTAHGSFRAGLRAGAPYAVAGGVLAMTFGVLAREAGFSAVGALVMSAFVFAGSAQFAAISIIAAGGGVGAAIGAAALMNTRFLPMGIALAPSLPGSALRRAAQGQTVVDSSWAMANRGDGRFDRHFLFGASAVQYVTWLSGTAVGAFSGDALGDPRDLGLDAIFPAFFLALLLPELRDARSRGVAVAGALVALALVSVAPPGVPVLAASIAALVGLKRRHARETAT